MNNIHPDLSESLKKRQQINRYSRWMYNNFKDYNCTFSDNLDEKNSAFYNFAAVILENIEKVIKMPFGIFQIIVLTKE